MRVIHVLRKPLSEGSVAANVLKHGAGGLHIDACRISTGDSLGGGATTRTAADQKGNEGWTRPWMSDPEAREAHAERVRANVAKAEALGRWPANVILQDPGAVRALDAVQPSPTGNRTPRSKGAAVQDTTWFYPNHESREYPNESGGVARFFKQIKTEGNDG